MATCASACGRFFTGTLLRALMKDAGTAPPTTAPARYHGGVDRAFLLLALTAVVDGVVVFRAPVAKAEKLALVLLQILLGCVALAATFTFNVLQHVDGAGRSLLTCAAGAVLFVVAGAVDATDAGGRAGWSSKIARGSAGLFGFLLLSGLIAEVLLVARIVGAWVAVVPAFFVIVVSGVLAQLGLQRARESNSALGTARARTDVVAAVVLGAAAFVAGGGIGGSLWAGLLAVAATLCTMARVAIAPPDRRDAVVVVVAAVLVACVVDVADLAAADLAAVWALAVCAVAVAVVAGRALLIPPRTKALAPQPLSSTLTPAGLGGVVPMLDDALLRRPGRPRVLARTPARRLLDAALDRAQRAQPPTRGRPPIDVQVPEGDADVDGDPSEIAEALCAILDNALRQQTRHPWARVSVVVRAAAQTVSFDVNDTAPSADGTDDSGEGGPFVGARDDVDRPGYGVSLARARLLVERHGGQLHARHAKDGSNVQVTLPRRLVRGGAGVA